MIIQCTCNKGLLPAAKAAFKLRLKADFDDGMCGWVVGNCLLLKIGNKILCYNHIFIAQLSSLNFKLGQWL